jgi:hypothetical protein
LDGTQAARWVLLGDSPPGGDHTTAGLCMVVVLPGPREEPPSVREKEKEQ